MISKLDPYFYNLGKLFSNVASIEKEAPAIKMMDRTVVTFKQLDELSNKTANFLLSNNIHRGKVIAIFNNKTIQSYAIMVACLKIGATYTNLDSNSPVERLKRMVDICKPSLFFTDSNNSIKITETEFNNEHIIDYTIGRYNKIIQKFQGTLPDENVMVTGNIPAYLMFTSGSTGFPKGVVISHANVLNFIQWAKITYQITSNDNLTNINPMHFDNSVFDFYASLFNGASLIPVTEDLARNPRKLIESLNILDPTIWFSVPSMLVYALKLRAFKETDLSQLRVFTFGGEGFPKNQLRNLWNLFGKRIKFINVYGPTECTCICSSYAVSQKDIENDDLLPLGPLAPNFGQVILNHEGNLAGEEEIGELCITGPNVGTGYYNNPEKSKEVFIQNPLITTHRDIIYKSGDLVKHSSKEKLLYFCGRKDNQIKRMGYRIELEEIENALSSLSYIEENAVVYIKTDDDNGKIIACIHSSNKVENSIVTDLEKTIPSYMLPNEFRYFEHLPKNQNGKIDRLKLKEIISNSNI